MTTESDRLLITRVRQNDQSAWAELDKRYRGRLTAYVRRRLKDHASVEDVVQETFIGFSNSLANYDDRRDLQTWLFTIAAHKVTDQLRKMGRRPAASPSRSRTWRTCGSRRRSACATGSPPPTSHRTCSPNCSTSDPRPGIA